ncbi:MAG: hypothetical protein R3Y05_06555 [bacterium]
MIDSKTTKEIKVKMVIESTNVTELAKEFQVSRQTLSAVLNGSVKNERIKQLLVGFLNR